MRKEYKDRWNAPLVNPGITHGEYMAKREAEGKSDAKKEEKPKTVFQPTINGALAEVS